MRTLVTALTLALIMLTAPHAAQAQAINAEGAAHLKTMFQNILDKQAAAYRVSEGPEVKYDGEIAVEPTPDYYAITLPATIIKMQDEPKTTIKVGIITINATPHERAKQWKMTFTTPTPVLGFDINGTENLRVNIGKQKASGIWHEEFENFITLDATYENITANIAGAPNFMNIGKIALIYDFKEDENARWSGPTQITLNNLQVDAANDKGNLRLGKLLMTSTIDQAALLSLKNYATMITESQSDKADMDKIIDAIMDYTNGFTTDIKITDLALRGGSGDEIKTILDLNTHTAAPSNNKNIHVDEAHASFTASDLLKDKSNASLSFGYQGFTAQPLEEHKKAITPSNLSFTINNKNVPIQQIMRILKNATGSETGVSSNISTALLITKIPALLAMAGTTLDIEKNISNDTFDVKTTATATADITSIFGATAHLTTTIKNLDAMIEATKGLINAEEDQEITNKNKKLLSALSTLKEVGTITQDDEGNTIHTFKLAVDQTGTATLNGQPALPILFSLKGLF